jgi:LysM repeat protein
MQRIQTTLIIIAAAAAFCTPVSAADADLKAIETRLSRIEARLSSLEGQPGGASYTYDDATKDATNGSSGQSGERTYKIKDGDTIGSIAREHGVERADLLSANRLSEGQPIYIGESILIPGKDGGVRKETADTGNQIQKPSDKTSPPPPPSNQGGRVHTVNKGDTLMALSRKYSTPVEAIKSANGLRGDTITAGQKLVIPASGALQASEPSAPGKIPGSGATTVSNGGETYQYDNPLLRNDETYGYYTVTKGDNLFALGKDFFTSMAELQRLNRLGDSNVIHPGDELIVPTSKYNAYHSEGSMANR